MAVGADEETGGSAGWAAGRAGGWAGWLLERWHGRRRAEPRLALVERITLAPRQSLALIEAEGRRILVATSAEGGPVFYPLTVDNSITQLSAASSAVTNEATQLTTAQTDLMQADIPTISTQFSLAETQQTALEDVIAQLESTSNNLFAKLHP